MKGVEICGRYIVPGFEALQIDSRSGIQLPRELWWKYRSAGSAGSPTVLASSLGGRFHQALRLSFPVTYARQAVAELVAVSLALGFPQSYVVHILQRLASRYSRPLAKVFLGQLACAVQRDD